MVYKCNICNKDYSSYQTLWVHNKKFHNNKMNTIDILSKEGVLLNKECVICYKKFINIKYKDYDSFLNKNIKKYKLINNNFEDETFGSWYDDRFECLTCKNIVCCSCIMNMPDVENGKKEDGFAMWCNGYTKVIYEILPMSDTGIITCPICRTKDYRLLYTHRERGVLPEEILYDIKKLLK